VILVTAALKGGVGKTTTSVYLAAVAAAARYEVTLIDADPQASAAEWIETAVEAEDEYLSEVSLIEAPTDRLLARALEKISRDEVAIIDPAPGEERMLERALEKASVAVIPTRVGGVETARAEAVLSMVPRRVPAGLVITSARTYTRDYMDAMDAWRQAGVTVWGTIPERVAIAHGPTGALADDGIEAYKAVWRRAFRAAR
jgi:chromosome partitioning protein